MNTDELVAMLAKGAGPVTPHAPARRFTLAIGFGLLTAVLAMATMLGVRPDIADAMLLPMFWVKLAFPALVAAAALYAATRLARPGMRPGQASAMLVAMFAAMWLLAAVVLLQAAPGQRSGLVLGETWLFCLVSIPLLSLPLFAAAMWAMKGLAPTRLSMAGAAAGLVAGSASAAIYALHCPELAAPFLAVWYVLGMAIPAMAGALIGPRLLRW